MAKETLNGPSNLSPRMCIADHCHSWGCGSGPTARCRQQIPSTFNQQHFTFTFFFVTFSSLVHRDYLLKQLRTLSCLQLSVSVSRAPLWLSGMTYYLCCLSDQMFNSVQHMAG